MLFFLSDRTRLLMSLKPVVHSDLQLFSCHNCAVSACLLLSSLPPHIITVTYFAKISIKFHPLFPFLFIKVILNFNPVFLTVSHPTQLGVIAKFDNNVSESVSEALISTLSPTASSRGPNPVEFNLFALIYLHTL